MWWIYGFNAVVFRKDEDKKLEIEIKNIATAPDAHGKGYGRAALGLTLDYIRTLPCGEAKCCWLSYEPENEVARKLYRSFGFEEVPEASDLEEDEINAVLRL